MTRVHVDGKHLANALLLCSADQAGAGFTHADAPADERSKQRAGHTAAAIHPTRQGRAKVSLAATANAELHICSSGIILQQ
jgi:hypothetical protein